MEPGKRIVALVDDSYRDRIKAHYKSGGRVKLSTADEEIIERCEKVQEILMANRSDLGTAKTQIKETFHLSSRQQVQRYIEDAQYLMGAGFTMDRSYQRMIQLQDIEWGIAIAKEKKDIYGLEKLMMRREKMFQLDQPDEQTSFLYFEVVVIHAQFMPEKFADTLPPDWKERAQRIKTDAMKAVGLIEDVPDAEYTVE